MPAADRTAEDLKDDLETIKERLWILASECADPGYDPTQEINSLLLYIGNRFGLNQPH